MTKYFLGLFFTIWFLMLSAAPLVPVTGSVVKAPLNVRSGPGREYTIVGRLELDNQVAVTAAGKEWLEIRAPENTATWVMARYLKNNRLTAGVILRSGPGIGFEKMGAARAGMTVKTVSQVTAGGWVMIQPFYWTRVYVGRPAIKADEAELAKLPPLPRPGPPADKKITKLEQSFSKPCEPGVVMVGHLYPNEDKNSLISHILGTPRGDEIVTVAYVVPFGVKLDAFNQKPVVLKGCRGVLAGWDAPVLIATGASPGK